MENEKSSPISQFKINTFVSPLTLPLLLHNICTVHTVCIHLSNEACTFTDERSDKN